MTNRESQILIITGMHRSGTSLTASLLQSGGLDIGQNLMAGSTSNVKGHFEDLEFVEFHQNVLKSQGISQEGWTLIQKTEVQPQFLEEAKNLIAKKSSYKWGWKDPRTTLFLDFWSEVIPEAKFIFIYRSPWEVIDSLYRRGDNVFLNNPNFALDVWMNYNQIILNFFQQNNSKCLLFNLETIINNLEIIFNNIKEKFNIDLNDFDNLYDPSLLNSQSNNSHRPTLIKKYFPAVFTLYENLNQSATIKYQDDILSTIQDNNTEDYKAWILQDWLSLRLEQKQIINYQEKLIEEQNQKQNYQQKLEEQEEKIKYINYLEHKFEKLQQDFLNGFDKQLVNYQDGLLKEFANKLENYQIQLVKSQEKLQKFQNDFLEEFKQENNIFYQKTLEHYQIQSANSKTELVEEIQIKLEEYQVNLLDKFKQKLQKEQQNINQIEMAQTDLEMIQVELQQIKQEWEKSQNQLQQSQQEWEKSQNQLQQTQQKWEEAEQLIEAMESSKFWKLRRIWFSFKHFIGIKTD